MNRWVSGNLAWPLTERLCGRHTWRRLRELRAANSLSPEALRQLQESKLRRLLRHAAKHCPFYRDRLSNTGVDSQEPRLGIDDLPRLPLLSRDDIRQNGSDMIWADAPGPIIPYSTGGSSGEPLQFFIDSHRAAADWAARWRAREWWGLRPGDPEVLLWGGPSRRTWKDRLKTWRDAALNQHVLSAFDLSPASMAGYVRWIRDRQPVCFYGYASSLALLARFAIEEMSGEAPLANRRLRAVFTTGEVLTPADRSVISTAFGVPVEQEYGCRDGGLLGCACPHGSLHVPQENVIVEIVDEDGHAVPPGQPGDVVITYLETFAMPMIRYRNGDVAIMGEKRCPCGHPSQILTQICGRRTDHIVCRRGQTQTRMHALALIYAVREVPGVRQFRIHQPSLDRLEVQIATGSQFTAESERRIVSGLLQRMGAGVQIEMRRCEQIPPLPSGKFVCVTSDVRESTEAPLVAQASRR